MTMCYYIFLVGPSGGLVSRSDSPCVLEVDERRDVRAEPRGQFRLVGTVPWGDRTSIGTVLVPDDDGLEVDRGAYVGTRSSDSVCGASIRWVGGS